MSTKAITQFILAINKELNEGDEKSQEQTIYQAKSIFETLYKELEGKMTPFEFYLWYRMDVIQKAIEKDKVELHTALDTCLLSLIQSSVQTPKELLLYLRWIIPQVAKTDINPLESGEFTYICLEAIGTYIEGPKNDPEEKEGIKEIYTILLPYIERAKKSPAANIPVALTGESGKAKPSGTHFHVLLLLQKALEKITKDVK